MTDRLLESYEAVPYDSKPIHHSHVARLEAVARLYGLNPAPSAKCRVLELGCASGGNLIPMAAALPDARFVGVDLAPSQIAVGVADIEALGLANVSLHAGSVVDLTPDFGEFDYIICHGIYSWVAPDVQDAILRVCRTNLAASGVAFVSYNVFPGWHLRGVARDLLVHNDDPSLPARERIARARAFMDALSASVTPPKSSYEGVLAEELDALRKEPDAYLLHEELAPFNSPLHFSEFARRVESSGLRYVADARLESNVDQHGWSTLVSGDGSDAIRVQQALDFARGTTFRRSLLCHDTLTPALRPNADTIREMYVATRSAPTSPSEEDQRRSGGTAEAFRSHDGVVVTTNNPVLIAAFRVLLQVAPGGLSFAELKRRIVARLQAVSPPGFVASDDLTAGLGAALLQCALGGMVELLAHPLAMTNVVSERPAVSAVARHQAAHGRALPNLCHYSVAVTGLERLILLHLDGTRTRRDLVEVAAQAVTGGQLSLDGRSMSESELGAAVDATLQLFANTAFLTA